MISPNEANGPRNNGPVMGTLLVRQFFAKAARAAASMRRGLGMILVLEIGRERHRRMRTGHRLDRRLEDSEALSATIDEMSAAS